jgi:hypothetical protein
MGRRIFLPRKIRIWLLAWLISEEIKRELKLRQRDG